MAKIRRRHSGGQPVSEPAAGHRSGGWRKLNPGWSAWVVAVLALVLRLLYVSQLSRTPYYQPRWLDPHFYFNWAREIAAGNWIGDRIFVQSPLYAYVLAAFLDTFGERILPILLAQAIMGVGTCLLTARIARQLLGEEEAFLAGILAASYGPFLFFDGMVMKTSLSVFLTVLLVELLLRSEGTRAKLLVLSGIVFALTALVRDNFILLFPLLLAAIALGGLGGRQRFRACVLFTIAAAATIAPVTIRNLAVGHEFALLTTGGGEVFYIGNNPEAMGAYAPPAFVHADPMKEHDDFIAKASELSGRRLTPGESSSFWLKRGLGWIANHPAAWARLLLRKLIIFWNFYELPDNYNYYEVRQVLLRPVGPIGILLFVPLYLVTLGLIAPLGLTGMLLTAARWRSLLLIYFVTFGYMGTVLLFFNFARFRAPIVPFLCIFAGASLAGLHRAAATRWDVRRQRGLLAAPAFFVLAWIMVNYAGTEGRGVWPEVQLCLRLGDTYRVQQRFEDAEKHYRMGLQMLGDEPIDSASLGWLGGDANRVRQEIERERKTESVNFNSVRAGLHFGLGALWIDEGRETLEKDAAKGQDLLRRGTDQAEQAAAIVPLAAFMRRSAQGYSLLGRKLEAEKTYRAAIALEPDDFGCRYDLAGLLYETRRYAEALSELQAIVRSTRRLDPAELADYHFGMSLVRLNGYQDRERALYHLEKALEVSPDHPRKVRMRELVDEFTKSGVHPVADD